MEVIGKLHAPAALYVGTHWIGDFANNALHVPGSEPRVVQPVAHEKIKLLLIWDECLLVLFETLPSPCLLSGSKYLTWTYTIFSYLAEAWPYVKVTDVF
jgi:hypothetical protein